MTDFNAIVEQLKSLSTPVGIEAAIEKSKAAFEDLAAQGRANVEALVASNDILVKGSEDLGRSVAAYAQASVEKSVATGQSIAGLKSVEAVVEAQTAFVKESIESAVAEGKRVSEATVALLKSAGAPIQARIEAGVAAFQAQFAA